MLIRAFVYIIMFHLIWSVHFLLVLCFSEFMLFTIYHGFPGGSRGPHAKNSYNL